MCNYTVWLGCCCCWKYGSTLSWRIISSLHILLPSIAPRYFFDFQLCWSFRHTLHNYFIVHKKNNEMLHKKPSSNNFPPNKTNHKTNNNLPPDDHPWHNDIVCFFLSFPNAQLMTHHAPFLIAAGWDFPKVLPRMGRNPSELPSFEWRNHLLGWGKGILMNLHSPLLLAAGVRSNILIHVDEKHPQIIGRRTFIQKQGRILYNKTF